MTHFDIDKYAYLSSPLHRFDPRAKILCITALIISIVLIDDISILLIGSLIVILLVYISKIPLRFILKRLRWVAIFVFAILIVLPFTMPGETIFSIGVLAITKEGIIKGCMISLKAFSVILLIFPMLATMKFVIFIKALEKLRVPNKLTQIIAFTYRYIFVVLNEIQRMLRSIESRGFKRKMSKFSLQIIGNTIGMLLVRSYERSQQIYNSMVSRGYEGRIRTLKTFQMRSLDWLTASLIVLTALFLHIHTLLNLFELVAI